MRVDSQNALPQNWTQLQEQVVHCVHCPRLVAHRQKIAQIKKKAFRQWDYWGKPVPSLGNSRARLLIVGLAPAAHGANRTGRMFTGDRSGDFLFHTLHRFGFCSQPESLHRGDGLHLLDSCITAAARCAPPDNKPTREEMDTCRVFLRQELVLLKRVRVVIVLGQIALRAYIRARHELGWAVPEPRPKFGHGLCYQLDEKTTLLTSYHPSQQNTQTGRLTRVMFDEVFRLARKRIDQKG